MEGSREGRERERGEGGDNRCEEGVNLMAHPLAGLFELFAFGDALLRLLHILLSLLHPPLYAVHQAALQAREKSGLVLAAVERKSGETDCRALSAAAFSVHSKGKVNVNHR